MANVRICPEPAGSRHDSPSLPQADDGTFNYKMPNWERALFALKCDHIVMVVIM